MAIYEYVCECGEEFEGIRSWSDNIICKECGDKMKKKVTLPSDRNPMHMLSDHN